MAETAVQECLKAAGLPQFNSDHAFTVATLLTDLGDFDQAEFFIARFQQLVPPSNVPSIAPVAMRTRLLMGRKPSDLESQLDRLIGDYIREVEPIAASLRDSEKAGLYVRIAALYDLAQRPDSAIEWYRRAAEVNPSVITNLARLLGQQGQKRDAVQLCRQAFEKNPDAQFVHLASELLIEGQADAEAIAAAQPMFDAAMAAFPNDPNLLISVGNVIDRSPGGYKRPWRSTSEGGRWNRTTCWC